MKSTADVFSLAGNAATVSVALLAFWAYFFTSLPEDIARQFRTEISNLNEQLVDLRQERRNLDSQVGSARQEIAMLAGERRDLVEEMERTRRQLEEKISSTSAELATSQGSLAATKSEIKRLEQSRASLVREIVTFKLEGAIAEAIKKLSGLHSNARQAASLIAYKNWKARFAREVGEPDRRSTESMQAWSLRWDRWWNGIPSAWTFVEGFYSGFTRGHEGERVDDLAAVFRAELAESDAKVTGASLVRDSIGAIDTGALSADDQRQLRRFVDEYLSERAEIFNANIAIFAPLSASDQAVVDIGSRITKKIDAVDEAVKHMPAAIAGRFAG